MAENAKIERMLGPYPGNRPEGREWISPCTTAGFVYAVDGTNYRAIEKYATINGTSYLIAPADPTIPARVKLERRREFGGPAAAVIVWSPTEGWSVESGRAEAVADTPTRYETGPAYRGYCIVYLN